MTSEHDRLMADIREFEHRLNVAVARAALRKAAEDLAAQKEQERAGLESSPASNEEPS